MRTSGALDLGGGMLRKFFLTAVAAAFLAASPVFAETLRFTVIGIDCAECAPPILKALKGVSGVSNVKLDWKAGVAAIEVPEGFDRSKLRDAIAAIGYEAVFDGEARKDLQPLPEEERRGLDISSASDGARIDVASVIVPGKITVLDYWAEWCSPCHLLDARLQHLVKANPQVAVRRVNVGKWDNDAAKQATREFRLEALPYVRVYDAKGKFVGAVTGGSWDDILKTIEKAKGKA
jgi:thiol-disulfide isomerase/thioredoxin